MGRLVKVHVWRDTDSIICDECGDLYNATDMTDAEFAYAHARRPGHVVTWSESVTRQYRATAPEGDAR